MQEYKTPDSCLPWIAKQRTGKRDFWDQIIGDDWNPIQNAVDWENVKSVLDIGCGVGGIDVLIWNKCQPKIYLMDYDNCAGILKYGMQPTGEPYNSEQATKDMMIENGVEGWETVPVPTRTPFVFDYFGELDLIISCLSWGYHYPVQTYIEQARNALTDEGAIIIDVREDDEKRWRIPVDTMFREWRILARGNKREKIIIRGPKR